MEKEIITTTEQLIDYLRILSVYSKKADEYFALNSISFYDENGIIVTNERGFFDSGEMLSFKGDVIRKIKTDFSKKENFVIRAKKDTLWNDKEYDLYIYVENVDLQYKGLKKEYDYIYKIYEVNGIKIQKFVKNLTTKKYEYEKKIEEELNKVKSYNLPLEKEELKTICKNITKYNNEILKEVEYIKNYIPKEEDFE